MAEELTLGLLASYQSGLTPLRASGQDTRLIRYYLHPYTNVFRTIYYFSYHQERLEDFTDDPAILNRVRLLPKRWNVPAALYAFLIPLAYPAEFSVCQVFRVFQANGVFPLWKTKVPSLVTFGYRYTEFARLERKPIWKILLLRAMERIALRWATLLLVTTQELFNYVLPGRGLRPVALIPNGVDAESFKPSETVPPSNGQTKTILFIGRFEPQKNLESLIEAASRLAKELPVKLLWVGKGSLENDLRRLASSRNVQLEIQAPIPHEALPQLLQKADAFTLVSWTEGHPKVLLEAMSAGLPCVVSDSDGSRTLIEDGASGLLCDPSNPDHIASQLKRVLRETALARQLGQAARRTITEQYSLQTFVDREINILRELALDLQKASLRPVSGRGMNRWLDYSCRRRLLDHDLAVVADLFKGDVLEVGGGSAIRRGRFIRPWWQVDTWKTLNKDADAQADIMADAQQMPLADQAFDTLCCLETLEYLDDPDRGLKEMARVLKFNGTLILSVPYRHPTEHAGDRWRLSADQIQAKIYGAGFNVQHFFSQGGRWAAMAHALKSRISRKQYWFWRQLGGLLTFLPVEILMTLDRCTDTKLQNHATGFLLVARRSTTHA